MAVIQTRKERKEREKKPFDANVELSNVINRATNTIRWGTRDIPFSAVRRVSLQFLRDTANERDSEWVVGIDAVGPRERNDVRIFPGTPVESLRIAHHIEEGHMRVLAENLAGTIGVTLVDEPTIELTMEFPQAE